MRNQNESTIKALLSALWNLSAHCSTNKAELCAVDGALTFLVEMLTYEGPSKTLTIIENAGGILSNISSHIAVNESYRVILRQRNCLGILLQQLSSESLTIVSNACGTLWNLSARCPQDQQFLLDNNAVRRLSLLLSSKHKMISNGSSAALKNLMNFQPSAISHSHLDPVAKAMRLKELPTLNVRKQRAFEQALDQNLGETCENIDITTPPKDTHKSMDDFLKFNSNRTQFQVSTTQRLTKSANCSLPRSESKDSVVSVVRKPASSSTPPTPRRSIPKPASDQVASAQQHPVNNGAYQETDLDQITDFSIRYGELPNGEYSDSEEIAPPKAGPSKPLATGNVLILDDTVKCYETEGTPYVISNAASVTDLTRGVKAMSVAEPKKLGSRQDRLGAIENSGINTPERCTNYCEEGTPGVYDSYSSLDEVDEQLSESIKKPDAEISTASELKLVSRSHATVEEEEVPVSYRHPEDDEDEEQDQVHELLIDSECATNAPPTPGGTLGTKAVTFETPMMFSRHSSMESLSSIEHALVLDDRSSVVSDFSRLASGIISPSEIPDSPSQMVAHSPRRSSGGAAAAFFPTTPPTHFHQQQPLRSVFEDDINAFGVENTPAQFSCATSLSNLSLDDEPKIASDSRTKESKNNVEDVASVKNPIATTGGTTSDDSDEEGYMDTDLLATCINIGMNKVTAIDSNQNKPDLISQVPSHHSLIDDSTSGSDVADASLLEQCIRVGIQRNANKSSQPQSQPPIPGPKPIKPQHDDSLSSLSMDSEDDGAILRQAIAVGSKKMLKPTSSKPNPMSHFQPNIAEDSFSSVDSIDSGDTQNATSILEQCIQTGMKKNVAAAVPVIIPPLTKPRIPERLTTTSKPSQLASFKTSTQIERERQRERERKDEALFMECIEKGMSKTKAIPTPKFTPNYRRDQLLNAYQAASADQPSASQHLFVQPKNVQTTSVAATVATPSVRCTVPDVDETIRFQPHQPISQTSTTTSPINTPVAKNESKSDQCHPTPLPAVRHATPTGSNRLDQSLASISDLAQVLDRSNEYPAAMMSSHGTDGDSPKMDVSAMEQSNEFLMDDKYNASETSEFAADEDLSEAEFVSEVSRELLEHTRSSSTMMDKHKDPDLMMQSVERLTQELMSTAELLRTAANGTDAATVYERKSSTTNTWNEDTCPNEVSFPSNSWTTPNIAADGDDDDDATLSKDPPRPTAEPRSFILGDSHSELDGDDVIQGTSQPESLDTDTITLVGNDLIHSESGIRFQVGGPTFRDHRPHPAAATFHLAVSSTGSSRSFTSTDPITSASNMTNSTIITLEANKLATELLNMKSMSDSCNSLDLDAIRPPSGMDTVSGYFEPSITTATAAGGPPFSPQLSRRKKSLPAGLMAKRALSQFTNSGCGGMVGSLESVHSSCNLENVKPPSIMDELLDSMISVASITSEVG